MKIKSLLALFILAVFLVSCGGGAEEKDEKNEETSNSNLPKEVENLTLPDGWSDDVLVKIANEENVAKPIMAI
ncbi:MAG TPA: hypothetical protein PLO89_08940, partial [Spirochaetota bacterium]|nr:hypothetical protein [Spirochaetota bacterium]